MNQHTGGRVPQVGGTSIPFIQFTPLPEFIRACNYIFARPGNLTHFDGTGERVPLYIGESGEFDERLDRHEKLGQALRLGATEIHIHLLAQSRQERVNVETDLRHAHTTPLNGQPTPHRRFYFLGRLPLYSHLRTCWRLLLHLPLYTCWQTCWGLHHLLYSHTGRPVPAGGTAKDKIAVILE